MRPFILLVGIVSSFAFGGVTFAAIPPEVPALRTSQVYSPFYHSFGESGEAMFSNGSVYKLGYSLNNQLISNFDPTDTMHVGDLQIFITLMETPAGILFLSTHGSPDSLMVEGYPGTCVQNDVTSGCHQRDQAMQDYIAAGIVQGDEIVRSYIEDGNGGVRYYGIGLLPIFFTRHLTGAHGIVFADACDSFNLWPVFVDFHKVRNYVGFDGEVNYGFGDGVKAASAVFDNMAGAKNDGGAYGNYSIASLISVAQDAMNAWYRTLPLIPSVPTIILKKDAATPDAGNIRLYNAPRLIKVNVAQDQDDNGTFEKSLYSYMIGGGIYPYNPGNTTDYPSGGISTSDIGSKGPIKVVLRFSEAMAINYSDFHAIPNQPTTDPTKA